MQRSSSFSAIGGQEYFDISSVTHCPTVSIWIGLDPHTIQYSTRSIVHPVKWPRWSFCLGQRSSTPPQMTNLHHHLHLLQSTNKYDHCWYLSTLYISKLFNLYITQRTIQWVIYRQPEEYAAKLFAGNLLAICRQFAGNLYGKPRNLQAICRNCRTQCTIILHVKFIMC